MYVDVSRLHGQNAFVALKHTVDDGGVGLRAAYEEEDVGFGTLDGSPYLVSGQFAPFVESVGLALLAVGFEQMANHFGMRSVVVIAFERSLHCMVGKLIMLYFLMVCTMAAFHASEPGV